MPVKSGPTLDPQSPTAITLSTMEWEDLIPSLPSLDCEFWEARTHP